MVWAILDARRNTAAAARTPAMVNRMRNWSICFGLMAVDRKAALDYTVIAPATRISFAFGAAVMRP